MHGLMQDWPLTLDRIIAHAMRWHPCREVVSRTPQGTIERTDYASLYHRARRLSATLYGSGIRKGDRVATIAWNTHRHMEVWYATAGIGAICHTINPRLVAQQLIHILNEAGDRVLFMDGSFVESLRPVLALCPKLEWVVVVGSSPSETLSASPRWVDYEEFLANSHAEVSWGDFDEHTAAALCYTSGTTGNPKGVLYSHRSNFLHTLLVLQPDSMGLGATDSVLVVVPMYHANAWGLVYAAPAVGAKLVLPGAQLDGRSLFELLETEQVTFSAAVPTVWQRLLEFLDTNGVRPTTLKRVVIGGAACPGSMIRAYQERYGIEIRHAWGMTELSPIGTISAPVVPEQGDSAEEPAKRKRTQGRPPLGVDMRLMDAQGRVLPHDGRATGNLQVRGLAVTERYFKDVASTLNADGFFDTGDLATIDGRGFMHIIDRAKDLIKSGGEWISSITIENCVLEDPRIALAAVIGIPHEKWDERPLLLVKLKAGAVASAEDIRERLRPHIADWWMPEQIEFVTEIPLGPTGKIDKKSLRRMYGGLTQPQDADRG